MGKFLNLAGTALVFMFFAWPTAGWSTVPLPKPRPAGASSIHTGPPDRQADQAADDDDKRAETESAKPSPCRVALSEEIAVAPSLPPIRGPGECGGEDLVRLEAVMLSGGRRVTVKPAAVLRCTMASAIVDWVRTDLAALAERLGTFPSELDNFDSYECRGRNRVAGAKMSEHGKANALDVRGLRLADGKFISLTNRAEARESRERVLRSVCSRFSTVLGPGSDWYHEDHIHLDLAERRGGYRVCQWGIYDPLPAIAPLLPAARPDEAPPREETIGGRDTGRHDTGGRDPGGYGDDATSQSPAEMTEPEVVEPEAVDTSPPAPTKPRKSRRSARSPS